MAGRENCKIPTTQTPNSNLSNNQLEEGSLESERSGLWVVFFPLWDIYVDRILIKYCPQGGLSFGRNNRKTKIVSSPGQK